MMVEAVIAVGSNLDNPAQQVNSALATLSQQPEISILQQSALFITRPVGFTEQPDFINAVAIIRTNLGAYELLTRLHDIEEKFGRVRTFRNAPRVLDLDLIDYNHENINSDKLILPHPRAHERGFVLGPLAQIAPDYKLPGQKLTAQQLLEAIGADNGIQLFNPNQE